MRAALQWAALRSRAARLLSTSSQPQPAAAGALAAPAAPAAAAPLAPLPPHAPLAGVSPSYLAEHAARVAAAATAPTYYTNPGARGHVARLTAAELLALPPPRRPLYPISEAALTLKYLRSVSLSVVLAALALYLHARAMLAGEGGGGAREELEARSPLLARALVACGLASDLAPLEAEGALDVAALAARVYERFGGAGGMPSARAARLLGALAGGSEGSAGAGSAAAAAAGGAGSGALLSKAQFCAQFQAAAAGMGGARLYLAAAARLGVVAAPPAVLEALGELYDRVVAGRAGGGAFTPTALATLTREVGWEAQVETARAALADSAAGRAGGGGGSGSGSGSGGGSGEEEAAVALSRQEFVEFMAAAASAGGARLLEEERVLDAIKVFALLHLGSIRASAGVLPT